MATRFSDGGSRSTWREPQTMSKQLVNFITYGCESSAPFFVIKQHFLFATNVCCLQVARILISYFKNLSEYIIIFWFSVTHPAHKKSPLRFPKISRFFSIVFHFTLSFFAPSNFFEFRE
jgi:hypothetical protein